MRLRVGLVAGVAALAGAAGAARAEPATGALADEIMRAGAGPPSGGTRGYVAVPAEAFTAAAATISPIIYVNRCRGGCSFTKSAISDALGDQTIIGGVPRGTRMTLSEFAHSEEIWQQTLTCIREVYQPFNVQIVTEDPGFMPHHEAVLAGRPQEMGLPPSVGGIAPLDFSTCRPQNNVISFSFANGSGPNPVNLCWIMAQESAHAFGLDHEFDCSDPLTYIGGCGQKFFRNKYIPCGTGSPQPCVCGGATQNSYQRILGVMGPGTVPVPPPVVDVTTPADGATGLPRGFSVVATAIDFRGLNHLELIINGRKWAELPGVFRKTDGYRLTVPMEVPDGVMDVEVRGCGDTGLCDSDEVTVTRGAPCVNADTCAVGQKCEEGRCFWDPPSLGIGEACTFAQQCLSDRCADVGGAQICTEACVTGPNDACPEGLECNAAGIGEQGDCVPVAVDDGTCCSTGRGGGGALAFHALLGGFIGLGVTRRRRRRG